MKCCMADSCDRKATRLGLCGKHYAVKRVHGEPNYKRPTQVNIKTGKIKYLGTPRAEIPTEVLTRTGICACGCGLKTRIAHRTIIKYSEFKGYPVLFMHGHKRRVKRGLCCFCGAQVPPRRGLNTAYCSERCFRRNKRGLKDESNCVICSRVFKQVRGNKTCSLECAKENDRRYAREWALKQQKENPQYQERRRLAQQRRRVKINKGIVEYFTFQEIAERDGWKCAICKSPIPSNAKHPHPRSASIDHIIPVVKGGMHIRANVQLAHLQCNRQKSWTGTGDQLRLIG